MVPQSLLPAAAHSHGPNSFTASGAAGTFFGFRLPYTHGTYARQLSVVYRWCGKVDSVGGPFYCLPLQSHLPVEMSRRTTYACTPHLGNAAGFLLSRYRFAFHHSAKAKLRIISTPCVRITPPSGIQIPAECLCRFPLARHRVVLLTADARCVGRVFCWILHRTVNVAAARRPQLISQSVGILLSAVRRAFSSLVRK